ncbi:MAG: hypothetical protein NTU85_00465 [Candidatus Kaiserbacteria bacterium]|nr:hypothetical protein [Candidatus Kaiserbacteria bacterium]
MPKKIFFLFVYGFAVFGVLLTGVFFAVKFDWTNESGIADTGRSMLSSNQTASSSTSSPQGSTSLGTPAWAKTDEWSTLKAAIVKDREAIYKASTVAGIPSRLLVASLMVEQLRLFSDNRELFKTVFAPLQILGIQSQYSWGVMGMKQETAIAIENNLKDASSPFYLGTLYEHLLDFTTDNPDQERFARLTDQHNRSYSYLYGALYLKELMTQWQKAGFDISNKPDIVSTLFNIGFEHSRPNAAPQVGGAAIPIDGITYSFGGLAAEFYHSNELVDYFPN